MRRTLIGIFALAMCYGCVTTPPESAAPVGSNRALPRPDLPDAYPTPARTSTATRAPATITGPYAPAVASRSWRYIVIHHSASASGNAAVFNKEHVDKGWDELGYHFVIGNGSGSADGQIEIGPRWRKQKWGAHAKTPDNRYNDFGIGICLVGNFEETAPTAKQLQQLNRLVAWLMHTYDIPPEHVMGHQHTGGKTLCPGRLLNVAQVRSAAAAIAGVSGPTSMASNVDRELLIDQ